MQFLNREGKMHRVFCGFVLGLWFLSAHVAGQVRCTMPNGVVIEQRFADACPQGATKAETFQGVPVEVRQAVTPSPTPVRDGSPKTVPTPVILGTPVSHQGDPEKLSFSMWLVVGLLGFALVWAIKGSVGASGAPMFCSSCAHEGPGKTHTKGSILIEIILWLCFLIPGLIYTIWRHSSRHKVCASCGASTLIKPDSPMAVAVKQGLRQPSA
jgi:hypothetical protein